MDIQYAIAAGSQYGRKHGLGNHHGRGIAGAAQGWAADAISAEGAGVLASGTGARLIRVSESAASECVMFCRCLE